MPDPERMLRRVAQESRRSEQVMLICNYRETATVVVQVGTVIRTPHHTAAC